MICGDFLQTREKRKEKKRKSKKEKLNKTINSGKKKKKSGRIRVRIIDTLSNVAEAEHQRHGIRKWDLWGRGHSVALLNNKNCP